MKADMAELTPPLTALRASGRLMVRISTLSATFPQHFVCHGAPFGSAGSGDPGPAAPPRLTGRGAGHEGTAGPSSPSTAIWVVSAAIWARRA